MCVQKCIVKKCVQKVLHKKCVQKSIAKKVCTKTYCKKSVHKKVLQKKKKLQAADFEPATSNPLVSIVPNINHNVRVRNPKNQLLQVDSPTIVGYSW